ncbi:MAG TPA: aspartyl protease family protein [Telluria sp.]
MTKPSLRLLAVPLAALLCLPGAAAAEAAPKCRYTAVARLPVSYTGPSLSLTVPGFIDGTPAHMLVDTGAFETLLTRTGTERRGMRLRNTGHLAYGVGGSSRLYSAKIKEFSVGPARSAAGYLRVIGDTAFTPHFDAIVGAPFLLQADLEISLATKEIKFFRPTGCSDAFLGYWSEDALMVPFEANYSNSPNPRFSVMLNGHKLLAMIDSGATTTIVDLNAAKRAGLKVDAPGMMPAGHVVGVGERRVAHWITTVDKLTIGEETIGNARIGVTDTRDAMGADVVLGVDFLRSHRVLFAMSQGRLYFSYVGGDPLGQRETLEPWMQQEADAGNADAQFAVSRRYRYGKGLAKDLQLASMWLDKAAAGGQPHANLQTGQRELLQGRHGQAAVRLRAALDQLPAERTGALWLYLARVRGNQLELGRQELATTIGRSDEDEWPVPIALHFLGKIGSPELLKRASEDKEQGKGRACMAQGFLLHLDAAKTGADAMAAHQAAGRLECAKVLAADASARDERDTSFGE